MTAHDVARVLPDVPSLRNLCRSLAMTEAIMNLGGGEYAIVFSAAGAYVRGFDHESPGPAGVSADRGLLDRQRQQLPARRADLD